MSLSDRQEHFGNLFIELVLWGKLSHLYDKLIIKEVWRPQWVQDRYVEMGLSFTRHGKHVDSCAGDLMAYLNSHPVMISPFFSKKEVFNIWLPLIKKWESLDTKTPTVSGGRWRKPFDPGHFQLGR